MLRLVASANSMARVPSSKLGCGRSGSACRGLRSSSTETIASYGSQGASSTALSTLAADLRTKRPGCLSQVSNSRVSEACALHGELGGLGVAGSDAQLGPAP